MRKLGEKTRLKAFVCKKKELVISNTGMIPILRDIIAAVQKLASDDGRVSAHQPSLSF
jgi:hypothetical protein